MSRIESVQARNTDPLPPDNGGLEVHDPRPLVSLVVPAYNEAAIVESHLAILCGYMESLEKEYRWELIFVDDGSTDGTGELAEAFAGTRPNILVLHHPVNFGLGQALRSAFSRCLGDYVVTVDVDLSYAPDHIRQLLTKVRETKARVVVASPYAKGGRVSNVPWFRRLLSVWANRFLSLTAKRTLSTLTGMVRVYDGRFLRTLDLKSMGMEINSEVIYKAMLLHARVAEIPAHLNWSIQNAQGPRRRSSMRMLRQTMSVLLAGFLFKPFVFFVIPGTALLSFSLYVNAWVLIHFLEQYQNLPQFTGFFPRASAAVAAAYQQAPHTFIVGLMSAMLSIQLISLGILALQSKTYFEEMFHLATTIYGSTRENGGTRT